VRGLTQEEFKVFEDKRPQTISKFELVEDMPLTLGIVVDTSSSMADSLSEAKQAALGFLHNMITLRDKVFAISFSNQPELLIPPTDDVEAVEDSLEELVSAGWTTLHDAVVTGLYYFRGVRGRRAMVLLSDGDDTASAMAFRDALEYARRSGVTIYTIGLDVGKLQTGVRSKLNDLARETGGRTFFISRAAELVDVYREIEEELRSQYLVAYSSDRAEQDGQFRQVEVKVRGGKLKARTISGYYP
jgi:VWFA-related protein